MYIRTTQGKQEFSSCKSIQLIYNHDGLVAGQWVSNPSAELIAAEDWEEYIPPVIPPEPQTEPSEDAKVTALNKMLASQVVALDDESALEVIALFPTWISMLGKEVHTGERYYYNEALYKVIQDHTPQESWTPDTAHSLFEVISIEDGSKEHPIHFSQGMAIENEKYYTQYDVEYLCIRDSVIALYADLKDLVGNYVQLA